MNRNKCSAWLCRVLMLAILLLVCGTCAFADAEYSITFLNTDGSVAEILYAGSGEAVVPPGDGWDAADCDNITGHAVITPRVAPENSLTHLGVMLNGQFCRVRTVSTGSYRDDGDWYDAIRKTDVYVNFLGDSYTWDSNSWRYGAKPSSMTYTLSEGYKSSYADLDYLGSKEIAYIIPYNSAAPTQFCYYTVTFVYRDAQGNTLADTKVVRHGGSVTPPAVDSAYADWEWSSTAYQNVTSRQIIHLTEPAVTGYTITWKDQDGTVLFTQKVPAGTVPVYGGPALSDTEDADYYYTFSGWTPAITPATINKTYTAVYSKVQKLYDLRIDYKCSDYVIRSETVQLPNGASYDVDRSVYIKNYRNVSNDIYTVTINGSNTSVTVSYTEAYVPLKLYGKLDGAWIELTPTGGSNSARWVFREGKWGVCNYQDPFNTYRPAWKYGDFGGVFTSANAKSWMIGPTLDQLSYGFGSSFTDYGGTDLTYNEITIEMDDLAEQYYLMPGDAEFYTVTFHYHADPADPSSAMTSTQVIARKGSKATPPVTADGWGWDSNEYLNVTRTCDIYHVQGTTVQKPVASEGLVYNGREFCVIADSSYYTLSGQRAVNAGSHTATATLTEGCFWPDGSSIPLEIPYTIAPAPLTLTGLTETRVFNGYDQTVSGHTVEGLVVEGHTVSGIEWSATSRITWYSPAGAFTGTAVVTAADGTDVTSNYSVTLVNGKLTITALDISGGTIVLADDVDCTYTGSPVTPPATLQIEGCALVLDKEYTISWQNNVNAGTATILAKAANSNCTGQAEATFTILPRSIVGAQVTAEVGYDDGAAQEPPVTVVVDGVTLAAGIDYLVEYADNVGQGQGRIIVTGLGNYTGSASGVFEILPISRMFLPDDLVVIGTDAFRNVAVEAFVLPAGCQEIQSGAFADCSQLKAVYIASADMTIADDAFSGSTQVIIFAPAGGTVESWAAAQGVSFRAR